MEDLTVAHPGAVEVEVVDVLDPLHIHGEAFEAVGQLGRDRVAVEAADLLEIRELADLHAVAPDLPAEAPGAERRTFPVVFDEADVVPHRLDADGFEAPPGGRLHREGVVAGKWVAEAVELGGGRIMK